MAKNNSAQYLRYYQAFRLKEVEFNRQVVTATGLLPEKVNLKCGEDYGPCALYSMSMIKAKVIAKLKGSCLDFLKRASHYLTLHLAFKPLGEKRPISFMILGKASEVTKLEKGGPQTYFLTLSYSQKPPDNLILILGELLEARLSVKKRQEERIEITPENLEDLGLKNIKSQVHIAGIPRKCLIRDLSFSGAKIMVFGIAKFIVNKPAKLLVEFHDLSQPVELPGTIIRDEGMEEHKGFANIAVKFDADLVPLEYALRINNYLKRMNQAL